MKNAFYDEAETRKKLANFILGTERLSMGQQCERFEAEFSEYQGRKYSVLVNSGASANLLILQSLLNLGRLSRGDKIAFSALTWSTNVMPILQLGLIPVAIDCDVRTLNTGINQLEKHVSTSKPKAFFLTNALGLTGEIDKIRDFCEVHNIMLLEDNCESLGSVVCSTKTGNFGLVSSFSFFVAHHMSTIEGGMVCTDDIDLWTMLVQVRANGWDRNLPVHIQKSLRKEYSVESDLYSKYAFYNLAYNVRPTEITGFLGTAQLPNLEKTISLRQSNFKRIQNVVSTNPDFIPLQFDHMEVISAFAMPFVLVDKETHSHYVNRFSSYGIEIRPMIAGNMQLQPFYTRYVQDLFDLPGADHLHHCGFYCGNYPELTEAELQSFESCILP